MQPQFKYVRVRMTPQDHREGDRPLIHTMCDPHSPASVTVHLLGPARVIGAIWPRKNGKKGGILRLDHVPAELVNHQGVLFITPVEDNPAQPDPGEMPLD